MQTAHVTVLMTPDRKASLDASAQALGVSSGEYIRLAVEAEAAEMTVLVSELNRLLPKMQQSLDRSLARLEQTNRKVDALLRDMGFGKPGGIG